MAQLENIEAIEKKLWNAADTLRSNSNYASNEYFMPVMGLIFLRHAYSRYLAVKDEIEANLPMRGGKTRPLTKEDFSQKSAIFLQEKAQFDYLVSLTDRDDRARAIIEAMESIAGDYETLRGVLVKSEYQELDNEVLGRLLRTLNPEELKKASGDIFGHIYEYEDPHELLGKADYVMANPPFNVDEVDADKAELEANDWSLTPGRYVGVAPEEEDENFDFEEALRDIHVELSDLNAEAVELAAKIQRNFEELGV